MTSVRNLSDFGGVFLYNSWARSQTNTQHAFVSHLQLDLQKFKHDLVRLSDLLMQWFTCANFKASREKNQG